MSGLASYMVIFKKVDEHAAATDSLIDTIAEQVKSQGGPGSILSQETPSSRWTGGEIGHRYTMKSMRGFSAKIDQETLKTLENHPAVSYVEADSSVRV